MTDSQISVVSAVTLTQIRTNHGNIYCSMLCLGVSSCSLFQHFDNTCEIFKWTSGIPNMAGRTNVYGKYINMYSWTSDCFVII